MLVLTIGLRLGFRLDFGSIFLDRFVGRVVDPVIREPGLRFAGSEFTAEKRFHELPCLLWLAVPDDEQDVSARCDFPDNLAIVSGDPMSHSLLRIEFLLPAAQVGEIQGEYPISAGPERRSQKGRLTIGARAGGIVIGHDRSLNVKGPPAAMSRNVPRRTAGKPDLIRAR
jgi:hypothetical protein